MVPSSDVSAITEDLVFMHRTNTRQSALLIAAIAINLPTLASAQLSWESPTLLRPGAPSGVTMMVIDYGMDPHSGLGGVMAWRSAAAPSGFGFRISAARGLGDLPNYAAGIDRGGMLLSGTAQFPVELIWVSGAGASYGEYLQLAVPLGVAVGRSSSARSAFNPYVSARGVFEARFGSPASEGDRSLGLAIDIGADLALGHSRRYQLRSALSLGDRPAAAIGLHLGGGPSRPPVSSARRAP